MISFDGNEAPMWFIAIVLAVGVLCAAGTGLFSELTRRNATLKDLQIISLLRDEPANADALAAADAYEKKVVKRIDAYVHKRTAISLVLGTLVRGTPIFVVAMVIWPFTVLYEVWQGVQLSVLYVMQSFASWFLAGLMAEGVLSVMRPFVTPLSERWDGITGGGKKKGENDAGDVPGGKKGLQPHGFPLSRKDLRMRMIPVSSSDLAAVGYEGGTLCVEFHSGGTYCYMGVPERVYSELMAAPSLGKYFHRFVKNAFPYRKVG